MNLFDISIYPKAPTGACYACGANTCVSSRLNREFRELTGEHWPGGFASYGLAFDFKTLGLEADVPHCVDLCLGCAVEYMKQFNALLAEKKKRGIHEPWELN